MVPAQPAPADKATSARMNRRPSSCGQRLRYEIMEPPSKLLAMAQGCRPGKSQHVALRVAAADAMRDRRQRAQQSFSGPEISASEGGDRPACRMADEPRHVVVCPGR